MPSPSTDPVDFVLLGEPAITSPGLAEVVGAGTPRNWDERKGYALSGAWLWFTGRGLSEFSVILTLRDDADWDDYEKRGGWKVLTEPPPFGRRAGWLPIWHPFLEDAQIDKAVVLDRLKPTQTETGLWSVEIKFKQYRRPVRHLARPDTPAADAPLTERERELADLTAEFQRLASGEDDGPKAHSWMGGLRPGRR